MFVPVGFVLKYMLSLLATVHSCISPSKYKPPKLVTEKNPPLNRPSEYMLPPGGLIPGNCPRIQSKNGKFPSKYKVSPIDFETQISLRR